MKYHRVSKTKRMGPVTVALVLILSLTLIAGFAQAYSNNPPNGRTNAPGEGNCTQCHGSYPLNSGAGTLSVSGIGGTYNPGQTYDLVIELQDPNASRWGFQFTIIDNETLSVGSLSSVDSHTQVGISAPMVYGEQTSSGTQNGTTDGVTWTMQWTAPGEGGGDVTIYLVGNAANGNGGTSGDRIYAISDTWTENDISAVPVVLAADLKPNYPNPFNPRTTIAYELASDELVALNVYGMDGRLVRRLENGMRGEGRHEVLWDGLDHRGMAVSSGTYFYRLQAGSVDQVRTMVLVR